MKCVNTNRNLPLSSKLAKNKNRLNSTTNSLLTNAANMKITKAIANSKQNRKLNNSNKGLTSSTLTTTSQTSLLNNNNNDNNNLLQQQTYERENDLKSKGSFNKESFVQAATTTTSTNTFSNNNLIQKEIDYNKEQENATIETDIQRMGTTTANTIPLTRRNSPTPQLQQQQTQGITEREQQANSNNNNSTQNEFLGPAMATGAATTTTATSTTNLNLSSLAVKPTQFISVVNETSNQTVLRTSSATTNINEVENTEKNNDQQEQQQHLELAKTNTIITATTTNNNNNSIIKNSNNNLSTTVSNINDESKDHYHHIKKFSNTNNEQKLDNCNKNNHNQNNNFNKSDVSESVNNTTTTIITNNDNNNSETLENQQKILNNTTSSSDNNSLNKSVINSVITTTTAATAISSNTLENNQKNSLNNTNNNNAPQNYRGANNSVIITNYHNPNNNAQNSLYNSGDFVNSENILNTSSNDPNLNLAVIGSTPQLTSQSSPLASSQLHAQLAQHHSQTGLSTAEHWLNSYNTCAYDLSLNHPPSTADNSNKDLINLQLFSPLTQIHHSVHHSHTQNNPAYYSSTSHLINPASNNSNSTNPNNSSTTNYLHDDTMRSNTAIYSTPYSLHHDAMHHHHSLMGGQNISASTHTPTSIDEVIQDTLKDECLDDHHTGVSYLTLSSVVDVQSLKDSYHSANLAHELTHLPSIAPAHMQTSSPHHHLQTLHHLPAHHNNSASSGANSPSPSSALSQSGDMATLQSFTQLTNASAAGHRDIYTMLTGNEQTQLFNFTSPPSPVLSNR